MARILKPPTPLPSTFDRSVFLAGSIEMGQAEDWQCTVERALSDLDVLILNPRRDAWDSTWVQSLANVEFREQVEWELAAQEGAALIAMYFAPSTRAPITLLELGLCARGGKVIVCCPDGFWRKGNVDVVCARYGIPQTPDLSTLAQAVRSRLGGALYPRGGDGLDASRKR